MIRRVRRLSGISPEAWDELAKVQVNMCDDSGGADGVRSPSPGGYGGVTGTPRDSPKEGVPVMPGTDHHIQPIGF